MKRIGLYCYYSACLIYHLQKHDRVRLLKTLIEAANNLKGVVIKLLQFIALRTEIFSDSEKEQLLYVFDAVPVVPLNLGKVLSKQFPSEVLTQLTSIAEFPFASGSFSQVYKATHRDGRQLIIKVKRPGLWVQLTIDFLVIKVISLLFNLFIDQQLMDISATIKEFRKLTYQELDYKREQAFAEYFYRQYLGNQEIVIPQSVPELSNSQILTQEYLEGVSLTDILRLRLKRDSSLQEYLIQNNLDLEKCMNLLGMELLRHGAFFDYCYVDPHPGNILILAGNKIAFIDFGLVIPAPVNRQNYLNIIRHITPQIDEINIRGLCNEMLLFGAKDLYAALRSIDLQSNNANKSILDEIVEMYQSEFIKNQEKLKSIETSERENFSKMLLAILSYGKIFNLMIPEDFFAALKGITIYNSYRGIISDEAHPTREMYKRIITETELKKTATPTIIANMSFDNAMETLFTSLGYLAETRPSMYQRVVKTLDNRLYA